MSDTKKTCSRCGQQKPNDYKHFPPRRLTCRECINAARREKHRLERSEPGYSTDPAKLRAREVVRERSRQYRRDHLEEIREKDRARARRPERRERNQAWKAAHPDRLRELERERRERMKAWTVRHSAEDVERLRDTQQGKCRYCGRMMTQDGLLKETIDHVVAVSRGGSDTVENIVLACWECNQRKHREALEEFLRRRDRPGVSLDASMGSSTSDDGRRSLPCLPPAAAAPASIARPPA